MSRLLLTLNDFAKLLPRASVSFLDGSRPDRRQTYANASRFASENDGYQVVCGWLIIGSCIFQKHYVVRDREGTLLEITPDADPLPFVPHYPGIGAYADMPTEIFLLDPGDVA